MTVITKYLEGDLKSEIIERAARLIEVNPKLSWRRADELAAAQIVNLYRIEYAEMERQAVADDATTEQRHLYDLVFDAEERSSIQSTVIDLTGTRTLIWDVEDLG